MDEKVKKKRSRSEMLESAAARSADYEPDGPLSHDPNFMKVKKSDLRSIRIDDELLEEIKAAAALDGFDSYQAYIKVVMRQHIMKKKSG